MGEKKGERVGERRPKIASRATAVGIKMGRHGENAWMSHQNADSAEKVGGTIRDGGEKFRWGNSKDR